MTTLVFSPLYAPSLVEVATRQLREDILSGRLEPGARLVEEQICAQFSISRAPLREALRMLTQQGLVEHTPRRGARVTELTETDVEQLFALRRILERHAIETTFPLMPMDTDRLKGVRSHLEDMRQAHESGDELGKDDAHRAFHAAVVALADNRQLNLAYEPILLKLQRPMALNLRRETQLQGPDEGILRHQRLVAALATNHCDAILVALDQHGSRQFV